MVLLLVRLVAGVGLYSFRRQQRRKLLAAAVAGDLSVVGAQQPYERTQACSDIDLQGWMCSLDPNLTRIATQADESQQIIVACRHKDTLEKSKLGHTW